MDRVASEYGPSRTYLIKSTRSSDEYETELPDEKFDQWPKLADPGSPIGELQFTSIDLTVLLSKVEMSS